MKDHLRRRVKLGYGVAEFGFIAAVSLIQVYLLEFYVTVVGLKPFLAGTALALAVVWDGISDPLMGILSDRTRTRIGRRIPYMISGAALLAFALILVFNPPILSDQAGKFFYLLGTYLLFNTAATLFSVPYMAIGSEISNSSNERTEIYGWRRVFGNIGLLAGLLLPLVFMGEREAVTQVDLKTIGEARSQTATVIAMIIILLGAVTIGSLYGHDRLPKIDKNNRIVRPSIRQTLSTILKNRSFVIIILASIAGIVGQTINASISLLYYKYYLKLDEQDAVGKILFLFIISLVVSIPVWVWVSRRISKKKVLIVCGSISGLTISIAYPLLPVGQLTPAIIVGMIGGFFTGAFFLTDALVADMIRHDGDKTGARKEASYFGFLGLSAKLSRALGLALNGVALSLIGFKEQSLTQSAFTERGLSIIFGPGVGAFFLLAVFIFSKISLDEIEMKKQKIAV